MVGTSRTARYEGRESTVRSVIQSPHGVLLGLFIVAVAISPRLRLEGFLGDSEAVDIRFQDILLVPAAAVAFLDRRRLSDSPLAPIFKWWLPLMLWGILLVTGITALTDLEVSTVRRIGYVGRAIELFIIAEVVGRLFIGSGTRRANLALAAIVVAVAANVAWTLHQLTIGTTGTLLGAEVSSTIVSYGPKLVGEPSAFGTGQFFLFTGAVGAASLSSRYLSRTWSSMILLAGVIGTVVSESRVSFIALLVIVLLTFSLSPRARKRVRPLGIVTGLVLSAVVVFYSIGTFGNRLSSDGLDASLEVRVRSIWGPATEMLWSNPLFGMGPGGMLKSRGPDEAHNFFLRAFLDFGLIFGFMYIVGFFIVLKASYRSMITSDRVELRMFSALAFYMTLGILISGTVQDSMTAVMSSHLLMLALGLFAGALEVYVADQRFPSA